MLYILYTDSSCESFPNSLLYSRLSTTFPQSLEMLPKVKKGLMRITSRCASLLFAMTLVIKRSSEQFEFSSKMQRQEHPLEVKEEL
jgi:hypothetical protein